MNSAGQAQHLESYVIRQRPRKTRIDRHPTRYEQEVYRDTLYIFLASNAAGVVGGIFLSICIGLAVTKITDLWPLGVATTGAALLVIAKMWRDERRRRR